MSYKKMIKWIKKHPKGSKQNIIFHTEGSFTPSLSFLDKYFKYREECEKNNVEPLSCEDYYRTGLR